MTRRPAPMEAAALRRVLRACIAVFTVLLIVQGGSSDQVPPDAATATPVVS